MKVELFFRASGAQWLKFTEIDEEFLLEIGTCIGELMFAKLKVKTEQA